MMHGKTAMMYWCYIVCGQRLVLGVQLVDRALLFCLHLLYHSRFAFVLLLQKFFFAACRNGLHSYHDGPSQPPAIVAFPAAHMDV